MKLHLKNSLPIACLLGWLSFFSLNSCMGGDEAPPNEESKFESGVFIVNEGGGGNASGNVTFWDADSGKARQEVFEKANDGSDLGGAVKSLTVHRNLIYVVVSGAGKVVVANAADFSEVAEIQGLAQPQHFLAVADERAFISQWGSDSLSGSVAVVNLSTRAIEKIIPTGVGSGRMARSGNKVYVANEGGAGRDSFVTVIDLATEAVAQKILVGVNPNSLQVDKNGTVWALCSGRMVNYADLTDPQNARGRLIKIVNDTVVKSLQFYYSASNLVINETGDRLFYLDEAYGNAIFGFGIGQDSLNYSYLMYGNFRALGFYPAGKKLLAAQNLANPTEGNIRVFDVVGNEFPNIRCGINPVAFWSH